MIRMLKHWWWARQRAIDLRILWPQCKQLAPDMDRAKAAFAVHAYHDPAWVEFYGRDRLYTIIEELS